ncbi:MAG TPA: tannase/feruloyl esterase family alpha/beta hydrolase [Syntrophorhabdaceae bacterium]|nr:tannase/feruloyl esterase family alpha/beta hydrolase [Syntrophorhabdaceae bacterium]
MRVREKISIFVFAALIMCTVGTGVGFGAVTCPGIAGLSFTDLEFGKPVTFTSVTLNAATSTLPELCYVQGTIYPSINFILKIPTTTYNNRFIFLGSGGTAGSLNANGEAPYLNMGFAAVITDTGHDMSKGSTGWAVPQNAATDQLVKDYAYRANHEVANLVKKIINAYKGAYPQYSYWDGCSNGGREGFIEAQRYPEDFNGYLIGSPPQDLVVNMMGFMWKAQYGASVPGSKLCLQAQYVYDKCDKRDGLVDGLIENPATCRFDPMTDLPACPNDVDASNCWTLAQRQAIAQMYLAPHTSSGYYFGIPFEPGAEVCTTPGNPNTSGWGGGLGFLAGGAAGPLGQATVRDLFLRNPSFDMTKWNWDTDPFTAMARPEVGWMRADDPNLWAVKKRGAKIIGTFGYSEVTDPLGEYEYYKTVIREMGGLDRVDDFYKLYFIPGMFHCGGGIGCYSADYLTPLMNWVEKDIEPAAIIGSRPVSAYRPAITRPICPYPQEARYLGTGNTNDAANFLCATPIKAKVKIEPEVVNLSKGTFTAFITLPWRYNLKIADIQGVACEGAGVVKGSIYRFGTGYMAKFNTQDLVGIAAGNKVSLKVTLIADYRGKELSFEGSDKVNIK